MAEWNQNFLSSNEESKLSVAAYRLGVILSVLLVIWAISVVAKLPKADTLHAFNTPTSPQPAQFAPTGVTDVANCVTALDAYVQTVKIVFPIGDANVDPKYLSTLRSIGEQLEQCENAEIYVSGHADDTGGPAINTKLSLERAENVILELAKMDLQIDRYRILIQSARENSVVGSTVDPHKREDRRVEFRAITLPASQARAEPGLQ